MKQKMGMRGGGSSGAAQVAEVPEVQFHLASSHTRCSLQPQKLHFILHISTFFLMMNTESSHAVLMVPIVFVPGSEHLWLVSIPGGSHRATGIMGPTGTKKLGFTKFCC